MYMVLPRISSNTIHLNFSKSKIKYENNYGAFTFKKKWHDLKKLEYLSVFAVNEEYQANLWYEVNKITNLFVLPNKDDAMKIGYYLANKLNIDLLDATVKEHHQWVDKIHYKKTGEIKYLD